MNRERDLLYVQQNKRFGLLPAEKELDFLHIVLYDTENLQTLSRCIEVVDLTKFKVYRKTHLVMQVLRQPFLKPYQFLFNKN
jgi:hypothetical protein